MFAGYSLFLFSPRYTREHREKVTKWIERATNNSTEPQDREISLKRIDMIVAHDALPRLGEIDKPTLVFCADRNLCSR
jgi:aminoacrylate hydrolase